MTKAEDCLEEALDLLDDKILDPVTAIINRVNILVQDFEPVGKKARMIEKMLKCNVPEPSDISKPLVDVPAQIIAKLRETKHDVITKLEDFLPNYATKHGAFLTRFVLLPSFIVLIFNFVVSISVTILHPPPLPETETDYNLGTLQPSLVSIGTMFLTILTSWLATLKPILYKMINRSITMIETRINKKVDEEINEVMETLGKSGMKVAKEQAATFFPEVRDLVDDLKRVDSVMDSFE